jgi:broad-specificity NMP kinase
MNKFNNVFKRVLITGKQGTGKTMLARDININYVEVNDVSELPETGDFVASMQSDKAIELNGVINLHLTGNQY